MLYHLLDCERPVALADLATEVAGCANGIAHDEVTPDQRKQAYIALYHGQVPKLADSGAVTYDEQTQTLALVDDERLVNVVARAKQHEMVA